MYVFNYTTSPSCTFQLLMDRYQTVYTSPSARLKPIQFARHRACACRFCNMRRWDCEDDLRFLAQLLVSEWRASKGPSCCNTSAKEPSGCMLLFCPFFFFLFCGTLRWPTLYNNYYWFPEDEDLQIDRLKAIPKRAQPNVASFRPSSVNIPLPTAVQPDKLANRMVIVVYSVQFFQLTQQNFLVSATPSV